MNAKFFGHFGILVGLSTVIGCSQQESIEEQDLDQTVLLVAQSSPEVSHSFLSENIPDGDLPAEFQEAILWVQIHYGEVSRDGREIKLSNNKVGELAPLSELVCLEKLIIDSTLVSDISPLNKLVKLRELNVSFNDVNELSPLSSLEELRVLRASSTDVSELASLSGLSNLEELYLDYTSVHDLTPLSNLASLKILSLRQSDVVDISSLKKLEKLERVFLNGAKVSRGDIIDLQSTLPNCRVVGP